MNGKLMFRRFFSIRQKFTELWFNTFLGSDSISIYMFHCIERNICRDRKEISVTPLEFESFIERKAKEGCKFLPIEAIKDKNNYVKNAVIITFDDMFRSVVLNAIPVLRSKGIPYTVFIALDLVGQSEYISKEQLMELREDGLCTIGAHSISHPLLRRLSTDDKRRELSRSKHEEVLGRAIDFFAYPYGSYYACDCKSRKIVAEEFKYGFSTLSFALSYKHLLRRGNFLPRINVNSKNYMRV